MNHLPASAKEVEALGWEYIDVILVSGDAYVDHPSFGTAVIARALEAAGYRVAVIAQPNWRDDLRDFRKLGAPRIFFGVTSGNMDSMVNHYTANLRLRSDDAYTPGGRAGFRPDRAVTEYARILKREFPRVPVVLGGIEASLRRLTHYDYWSDTLRPSVLTESGAEALVYGMGERAVVEVAKAMRNGYNGKLLRKIGGIAFVERADCLRRLEDPVMLHSFAECIGSRRAFGENFVMTEREGNRLEGQRVIVEQQDAERYVIVNPPQAAPTQREIDAPYGLPYTRQPHPRYANRGAIPAYAMIRDSVNIHRGCFGGCSFCAISAHQGRFIRSRSEESILAEVRAVAASERFGGNLSDVGGPSANMYGMGGRNRELCLRCLRPSCLFPKMCLNLDNDHGRLLRLYERITAVKGIRRLFIGSGIRYDLFGDDEYLCEVVVNHTSGRLKVAPEHTEERVLRLMRKPPFEAFERLAGSFRRICRDNGLRCRLVPYFMSSHPGCTEADMKALRAKARGSDLRLDQVQDFTPTPMTLSSVMFHCGFDPFTGERVHVARDRAEKLRQKGMFFA